MVETVGALLGAFVAWMEAALPKIPVGWSVPADGAAGIGLRVLRVEPCPAERRAGRRDAVEATLLLQPSGADPLAAATLAGDLAFACADGQWVDGEGTAHRIEVMRGEEAALALRPAGLPDLASVVRLPFARDRDHPAAKPVLRRLRLETGFVGEMDGIVLGRRGDGLAVPLDGAAVSAPTIGRSTLTASGGSFRLTGVPPDGEIPLEVAAKGRTLVVAVSERRGVIVHMQLADG